MKLMIQRKRFDELLLTELYSILQLRSQVFNVEQACNELEIDNLDLYAFHLLLYSGQTLCGYARLIPPGLVYREMSIGRVVVPKAYRGNKIGRQLMEEAIRSCYRYFGSGAIRISAQRYAQRFYESLGFEKISGVYMKAGIEHIKMQKPRQ